MNPLVLYVLMVIAPAVWIAGSFGWLAPKNDR